MKRAISFLFLFLSILSYGYAADSVAGMFTDGTASVELRIRHFDRDYDGNKTDLGEQAIGGIFRYKTADLKGVSLGLSIYNSNNIDSDDDDGGYELLKNDNSDKHKSFTKMGEAYVQGEWMNTKLKLGAQEIETPYINGLDARMAPKSYKGASVVTNAVPNLEASFYYITEFMDRAETSFHSVSKSFSDEMDDENPLIAAGLKYSLGITDTAEVTPQAWYYTIKDGFAFTYFNLKMNADTGRFSFCLEPSYLKQDAIGDKTGGDLDTGQYGASGSLGAYGFSAGLYYAKTGDGDISAPYGHSKIVAQQVMTSGRAQEKVYGVKAGYDFTAIGLTGLSAYIFYADYNTPDSGRFKSYDAKETDYDIMYKFQKYMKGLTLRAKYAVIDTDEDQGGTDYTDTRLFATYMFKFGGPKNKSEK